MPCAVFAVGLSTSQLELHNLHDHSPRYVAGQFLCSFWFSTKRLLAMSVAMYLGITGVHLPLNSTGIMVSKIEEMKTLFRAHLGM